MGEGQLLTEEFFTEEDQEVRKVILEIAGIEEGQKVLMVSGRVVELTVESKGRPDEYESVRGYTRVAPDALRVNVAIHRPDQMVNSAGDAAILGQVMRIIGGEVDQAVVELVHRHQDRKVILRESEPKPRRVDAGREVKPKKPTGELL